MLSLLWNFSVKCPYFHCLRGHGQIQPFPGELGDLEQFSATMASLRRVHGPPKSQNEQRVNSAKRHKRAVLTH